MTVLLAVDMVVIEASAPIGAAQGHLGLQEKQENATGGNTYLRVPATPEQLTKIHIGETLSVTIQTEDL